MTADHETPVRATRAAGRVTHPLRTRLLTVQRVADLGAQMRRIALGGTDLEGFAALGPTDHVKVFFPESPGGEPILPAVVDGAWVNRADPALTYREYTVRTFDPAAGQLVLDMAVHAHGPAGRWAAQAESGQRLAVLGPKSSKVPPLDLPWYVLAADLSGLPALLNWLDVLPAGTPVQAFVQVDRPDGPADVPVRERSSLVWVPGGTGADRPSALRDAVADAQLPDDGAGLAWGGAEAGAARALRRHLLVERGLPRAAVDVTGYWRAGVAHFDHKSPEATA